MWILHIYNIHEKRVHLYIHAVFMAKLFTYKSYIYNTQAVAVDDINFMRGGFRLQYTLNLTFISPISFDRNFIGPCIFFVGDWLLEEKLQEISIFHYICVGTFPICHINEPPRTKYNATSTDSIVFIRYMHQIILIACVECVYNRYFQALVVANHNR